MIKIRKFHPNDIFQVIKLASKTLSETYNPTLFNYFYEAFPHGFLVAEKNHKIIGFIVGVPLSSENAKILMLSILESQRRQKIGTELLKQFLNEAADQNIKNIDLDVRTDNKNAIKFYQKYGFKITKRLEKFYQNGEDAYNMKISI